MDNRYGIINKSLTEDVSEVILLASGSQSSWGILQKNGTIEINGCFGSELTDFEIKRDHYSKNPILFNLENFNPKLLDSILFKSKSLLIPEAIFLYSENSFVSSFVFSISLLIICKASCPTVFAKNFLSSSPKDANFYSCINFFKLYSINIFFPFNFFIFQSLLILIFSNGCSTDQ